MILLDCKNKVGLGHNTVPYKWIIFAVIYKNKLRAFSFFKKELSKLWTSGFKALANWISWTCFLSGLPSIDPSGSSPSSSSAPLTSFSGIPGTRVFLQGPAPVGTPSFNRQHFSPHPWTSASNSCRNPGGILPKES